MNEMLVKREVFDTGYFEKGEAVSITTKDKRFDAIVTDIGLNCITVKYYSIEDSRFNLYSSGFANMYIELKDVLSGNIKIDKLCVREGQ